ncbi:unnamed protein product [Amoebophrya sp. A120]|nr:unnamed protein product [Amoebophrya sp. A120]|eukprot:GSA120T00017538001.1
MGLFRSETMCSGTLVLPVEKARHFVDVLGSNANLQFQDLHAATVAPQRPYKKFIQRIEEVEREVRFLLEKCRRAELTMFQNDVEGFLAAQGSSPLKLDQVEAEVRQTFRNIAALDENQKQLLAARNASIEERYVVESASMALFQGGGGLAGPGVGPGAASGSALLSDVVIGSPLVSEAHHPDTTFAEAQKLVNRPDEHLLGGGSFGSTGGAATSMMFNNAAGVVNQLDQERFAKFVFRSTRGNAFTHFRQITEPLTDPKTGEDCQKSVFVIYYQGNSSSAMHARILRACNQFGANTYPWVTTAQQAREKLRSVTVEASEKERALMASERLLRDELLHILERQSGSYNSLLEDWRLFLLKEKGIYAVLDMCEGEGTTLRAQVWYPAYEEDYVRRVLIAESRTTHCSAMLITDRSSFSVGGHHGGEQKSGPPTYFKTNAFLSPFQTMVNTYGVPRYQEMTPVLFSAVTFPFLFGVMFGDIGHGLMLFAIGIGITQHEHLIKFQYPAIWDFRYMLVMMGFFAVYAGLLYNDFFSLGVNLLGSRWRNPGHESDRTQYWVPNFDPKNRGQTMVEGEQGRQYVADHQGPYPFGVDPAWKGAQNELNFMNSMKMKISVLLGVAHMILGLFLRLSNVIFERNRIDFCFEFVPMMMFMVAFFGYMDYMILYKWVTPMRDPPSIINTLICMVMQTENKLPLYEHAKETQWFLFQCMLVSVPLLLIPKPLILWALAKHRTNQHRAGQSFMPLSESSAVAYEPEKEPKFDFGETCIHQIIETIEFVLGSVSHTASYLRLWALSLAHQQLSVVFFKMLFASSLAADNFILIKAVKIYVSFFSFMLVTVAIFLGMDVMECFMHTLRLHWVEFQSKFYRADGHEFLPFRHEKLLSADRGT